MNNVLDNILTLLANNNYSEADLKLEEELSKKNIDLELKEKYRRLRTFVAEKTLKRKGFRNDVFIYLIGALEYYKDKKEDEIKKVAFEIGQLADKGFHINEPDAIIEIKSLGKKISHLQALCYMYAGFKIFEPELDIGIDFKNEFEQAKRFI